MHVLYGFDVINEIDKPNRSGLYFLIRFAQTKITLFIFWNNWVIKENERFLFSCNVLRGNTVKTFLS